MDLEQTVSALQIDLAESVVISSNHSASNQDWIPQPPARATLTGHRSPLTSVAIHPSFGLVASASEDATLRLWDLESGSLERILKGHTKAVNCVAFDRGERGAHLIGNLSSPYSVFLNPFFKYLAQLISVLKCGTQQPTIRV
jgi:WD40 repeat protein